MKYLIIGAGAVGATIGGFLAHTNKDVSMIARGEHLKNIQENGLILFSEKIGDQVIKNIQAFDQTQYSDKADVIFVCVKSYSIEEILPTINAASHENTIIIPILNTFGTGEAIASKTSIKYIFDGCIYIAACIPEPGVISQTAEIFRIVCGPVNGELPPQTMMDRLKSDLNESKIELILSKNINEDKFKKFSLTSAFALTGAYFDISAEKMQTEGECREMMIALLGELKTLSIVMNLDVDIDIVKDNLIIIDKFKGDTTASLQRDLKTQNNSEIDGLLFNVLRLGKKYKVDMPTYEKVAKKLSSFYAK